MSGKSEGIEEFVLIDGFEKKEKFLKEFIQEKVLPSAIKMLASSSLDPQQLSSTFSIGHLQFQQLNIPIDSNNVEVHVEDKEYIVVTIENCSAKLKHFTWKYCTYIMEDSGRARIHFHNAKSTFRFYFRTTKLPPMIELKLDKFDISIKESEIEIVESQKRYSSYVYQFLVSMFPGMINKLLSSHITSIITQYAIADSKAISAPWLRALQM